ncbi:type 4a pilus biogenesis protein PilO [Candidatus Parabeggiatoa sp. HSG14]|uniref:type 4a pilus biogenesis protein PilO n=1 Tax=Candidatus Parabeggiatoa sp. HSG14 TaxID=3055593 RepID=UPI0025A69E6D|nr:type 4a pilus biogenesis protein PilO [Thiotrichales bacterium HSG14]
MKVEDFSNLDPKNFGNWPIPVKALIIIVLCAAALFAGYWFDTQNQMNHLVKTQAEENKFKKEFKDKQWKAATLPKLKEQLAQIESTLSELLKKLPNNNQVHELIRDISQTVLASGLTQELFKPDYKKETKTEVYVTLPIKLRATGDYHAFGKFVSGVAAMNRIVTQHNVSVKASKRRSKKGNQLTLEMVAQIYRYRDPSEVEKEKKKAAKKNKKKSSKKAKTGGHGGH